jgi:hypothetical protein
MKKTQNVLVWLKKTVLAQHNYTVCGGVWRLVKGLHSNYKK